MQNPNQANLQAQMNDLQRQIDELQRMLQSGKDANGNPLSKEQMEQLKKQLESLQQQMRALKLSQEAQEFLRKLMNDPAYKEAMEHLRKLAEQMQKLNQQQDPQQRKLTQEEIEKRLQELERKLEELAKKYNTDEKIRELAQQLLEQVKQMKELSQCQGACLGLGMGNCFGLGMGMGGAFGTKQKQAWDKGEFVGQPELFNQGDKQPELKIPMKDTAVSGQPPLVPWRRRLHGLQRAPNAWWQLHPAHTSAADYQKKAEQALSQQNVPPAERKRVKRYFESLQSGK
jgi:hypothetical protein